MKTEISDKIRQIMVSAVDDKIVHGTAVLAGNLEKDLFSASYGFADANHKYPMTTSTVLDVASTTKASTVITALLILHSRNLIDFDEPFTKYLPAYSGKLEQKITVRDLANHTSGFGDVPGQTQRLYFDENGRTMIENVLKMPPPLPKSKTAAYACWNYILLTLIIEHVAQRNFDDFCNDEIFTPLNMHDTSLGIIKAHIPIEKQGQTIDSPQGTISDFVAQRIWRDSLRTGNAGLFTSANDFAKLLRSYLSNISPPRLFGDAQFKEIAPDKNHKFDGYRKFGWIIYDSYMDDSIYGKTLLHSGWSGQTILLDYEKRIFIIILTTRCGNYERAKSDRFKIIQLIENMI